METRMAKRDDLARVMELIGQAKQHLKEKGVDQWQDGYPSGLHIERDIANQTGYLLLDGDAIVGYTCISFDGEEAYDRIKGQWLSLQPYAVIHRMAVDPACQGQGLAHRLFQYAEELCRQRGVHSIKVDTDNDNAAMKHILHKNGYAYCGGVRFQNSDKIGYEKLV